MRLNGAHKWMIDANVLPLQSDNFKRKRQTSSQPVESTQRQRVISELELISGRLEGKGRNAEVQI